MQTTQTDRESRKLPAVAPVLMFLFSGDDGCVLPPRSLALPSGEWLVGRDVPQGKPGLSLASDHRASRVHARLQTTINPLCVRICDERSKNGTFVNGQPVQSALLTDGDLLRIGSSFFVLRTVSADPKDGAIPELLGVSPPMRALRSQLVEIAKEPEPILILGESGTGKEVVAQALHRRSGCTGPLVPVNCAAIPESLAESVLFGHKAGAFTNAQSNQLGHFREAHGGTLFLDEIGELPPALQAKLLRAVESHKIMPVGSSALVDYSARLLAATNRDLWKAVQAGLFRADLFARLAAHVVKLPPLRQRPEDILLLLRAQLVDPAIALTPRLVEALLLYRWPLNVRELVQLAGHLRVAARTDPLLDLPLLTDRLLAPLDRAAGMQVPLLATELAAASIPPGSPEPDAKPDLLSTATMPSRETMVRLLQEHHGIINRVAKVVQRSRRQVYRWMEQYGIRAGEYKPRS